MHLKRLSRAIRSAFKNCTALTSVVIPSSVKAIGPYAFSGCTKLESVALHDTVRYIGHEAFFDCFMLTDITLPKSITYIGSNAFGHSIWRPKKSMTYSGTKAEWGAIKKEPTLSRILIDCTIHCTDGDVDFFFNG